MYVYVFQGSNDFFVIITIMYLFDIHSWLSGMLVGFIKLIPGLVSELQLHMVLETPIVEDYASHNCEYIYLRHLHVDKGSGLAYLVHKNGC